MSFIDEDYCSNAPWKDKSTKYTFTVFANVSSEVTIELPESLNEQEIKQEMLNEAQNYLMKNLIGWDINDIDIEE